MKRILYLTSIIALFSLSAFAQDDVYSFSTDKVRPETENTSKAIQELMPSDKPYLYEPTHNAIRISYALGGITSDVYCNDKVTHPGLYGWQLDYTHLWGGYDGQHGLRISYSHEGTNATSVTPVYVGADKKDGSFSLAHIGVAYVYSYTTTLGWVWTTSAGLGATFYSETGYDETGFGAVLGVGCEYKCSRNFSLGVECSYRSDNFSDKKDMKQKNDESRGFKHISLLIGPRFYF